jgi:ribose transport system substrate-binding protein
MVKGRGSGEPRSGDERYVIDAVLRACDVLKAFHYDAENLRLRELVSRTGLSKTTVFRILHSLQAGGLVERISSDTYRATIKPIRRRGVKLGYAAQGRQFPFSREVTQSIEAAANQEGIDLVSVNNQFSPKIALRNANQLIDAGVHIAIEHQTFEEVAPAIAAKFKEANIPLIAVGFPHPGAIYYGASNYQAGLIAGNALARCAKHYWQEEFEELILVARPVGGPLAQTRVEGIESGLRQSLVKNFRFRTVRLNGDGQFAPSLDAVRKYLRHRRSSRVLVGAINDCCALGAIRAFEEAGCLDRCVVVGQGASMEGRAEIRRSGTRLFGSVAYFPENYGPQLVSLALGILGNKPLPTAIFVKHRLITREHVDHFYPNDVLLSPDDLQTMLWQMH